jgi:hypothetical protein
MLPACAHTNAENARLAPPEPAPGVGAPSTRSAASSSYNRLPATTDDELGKERAADTPSEPSKPVAYDQQGSVRPAEAKLGAPEELEVVQVASRLPKAADEPPVVGALRSLLEKRPEEAMNRLELYDKSNQELLLFFLPLIVRLTEGGLQQASPQDMAVLVEELNSLMGPMRSRAALLIENMCFCKRIETFGVYEPLPCSYEFHPSDRAQVYLELRNFTSRKGKNDAGETRQIIDLKSTAEIRDFAGRTVWKAAFERQKPDQSRTPRQDYFDNYCFFVPDLPPGAYSLWIQVEDRGTRPTRTAGRSLDFRITNLAPSGT